MQTFSLVLVLLAAVIASTPAAKIARILPLPIVQILIGIALAWPVTGGVHIELEPEAFLLIFILPLLYGDAWLAPKREFKQLGAWIIAMAFGLVFFTILSFGLLLNWLLPETPLAVAFAAAAVLSPTDAVAVSSIINKDRLPPPLLHLLEGEALLNDASGLVMFRFATAAAMTGSFSLLDASGAFLWAVVGGAIVGLLCLWLAALALKLLEKLSSGIAETQVLVTLLLPFMAYLLAEQVEASGVLAAVVAGLYVSRFGLFRNLGVTARMLSTNVWELIRFALNGAIFVLLGLQLPAIIRQAPPELIQMHWILGPLGAVIVLTLCLMALRYLFLLGAGVINRTLNRFRKVKHQEFSARGKIVAAIGGVRGAVTLAGILSLPVALTDGSPFPARDLVIFLAAGVILCWLAIATVALPRLSKGLASGGHERDALEMRRARIKAAQAAIDVIHDASLADVDSDEEAVSTQQAVAQAIIQSYERRIDALHEGATPRGETKAIWRARVDLRAKALDAEHEALRDMLHKGEINDTTFQRLIREVLLNEAALTAR